MIRVEVNEYEEGKFRVSVPGIQRMGNRTGYKGYANNPNEVGFVIDDVVRHVKTKHPELKMDDVCIEKLPF